MPSINFEKIYNQFSVKGSFKHVAPYGSGHINDTYLIKTRENDCSDYILQRINRNIFKDIPRLQENILRVTSHLRKKISLIPGSEPDRETLTLALSLSKLPYYRDDDGNYWRVYLFISNHRSYNRVETPGQAYEGGRAYGRFLRLLSDLEGPSLHDTIPYFHNMEKRLQTFFKKVKANPVNRVAGTAEEIRFVEQRSDEMLHIQELGKAGKITGRVTHNDTKFNNVLLDENDKALCVIDLDTVMQGYVLYDFGDAIRTSTNTSSEDEPDLSKVELDIELFESFSRGFLKETAFILNDTETGNLAFSGKMMTFIIGLRFLTDYLDGDNYFKTHHKHHNLQRAKTQFKLVSSMERQYDQMQGIVSEIVEELRKKV